MLNNKQQDIDSQEEILVEQGIRIRALHEIISRPGLSFDQQIDAALRLGCQLLGTEVGKVGRQEPDQNTSHFLNTVVLSDLPAKRGMTLPLDKTFCHITFSSQEPLAINHVAESDYKHHPAAGFIGMQSYIGCTIHVHGRKFGTVNFSNRSPVKRPFTEADKDLVKLIGSWISVMMERQLEAEELKKSKEAADAANQAKSSFLANMSHEIRTPLTSIIGYAESALDDVQTTAQRIAALQIIHQSSNHLLNLLNDILDFSKIEAGMLDIEYTEFNPCEILSHAESILAGSAHNKHLQFTVDYQYPLPEKIFSDPLRLKQIILNICSNAIKFTHTGSVQVIMRYDPQADRIDFVINDTGIGIQPEHLEKIFTPFKQADTSVSRRFGGTGLGLSLSKRLAELINGELSVTSEPGVGSKFVLSLYKARENTQNSVLLDSPKSATISPADATGPAEFPLLKGDVLLVEDNEMVQQLIKTFLVKMGLTVTLAENGVTAITLAQQYDYDLIYMDMQMPVMSGVSAVKILRQNHYQRPIVMLTANAALADRNLCKEAGCDDFLTKPINRKVLYETTRKFLDLA